MAPDRSWSIALLLALLACGGGSRSSATKSYSCDTTENSAIVAAIGIHNTFVDSGRTIDGDEAYYVVDDAGALWVTTISPTGGDGGNLVLPLDQLPASVTVADGFNSSDPAARAALDDCGFFSR